MRFVAILLLSCFISTVSAQETAPNEKFSLALGAGLLFNQADTDNLSDVENADVDEEISASLNVGARALYYFNDSVALRTGLYLQEKSAKYSFEYLTFDGEITARFIQAAVPLNLQVKLNDQIAFFGGYSADFHINEYCKTDGDFESGCYLNEEPKAIVHNANLGISIKGNEKFDIDISYQRGLTDVTGDLKIHSLVGQFFIKI